MNDMWGNPMGFQSNSFNQQPGFNNYALRHYEIIKVNGEEGAKSFRMAPNSNILLLDNNDPIVWFVQTDGAGYSVVTPYDLLPHKSIPPIDINQLAQRVAQLEETINVKQSDNQPIKQSKRQQQHQSSADTTV